MSARQIQIQAGDAIGRLVPIVVVIAILIALLYNSVVIVDSGHVGVVRTLGEVQMKPLPEGFHFRKPFIDKVEQIDVRLTTSTAKAQAASRDLQIVTTDVTVQYALIGAVAPKTYQSIGVRDAVARNLIEPAIQESVKAVTAKYTAEALVTQRAEVKLAIHEAIRDFIDKTLSQEGVERAVNLANVAITDFNFSDEFNRAIELKVKAEQEALQAENEKTKLITQAEAAARQIELAADAAAYQIQQESIARALAIEREAKALRGNPELITLRTVEAWNGTLPRFVGSESAIPFLNINEAIGADDAE